MENQENQQVHASYVADRIKELEEYAKNSEASTDDLIEHVGNKLDELYAYANEHDVLITISEEDIVYAVREEESSSYYESSSSYEYSEEEEYSDEEDEENEECDNPNCPCHEQFEEETEGE